MARGGFSGGGRRSSSFGGGSRSVGSRRPMGGGMSRPSMGSSRPSIGSSRPSGPSRPSIGPSRPSLSNRPARTLRPARPMRAHRLRPLGPPRRSARYNRYGNSQRRNYRYRYYPHRRYYHVHGYRGAHYGMSFTGFLATMGILLLILGIFLGMDDGASMFNVWTIVGAGLIGMAVLLSIVFSKMMAGMRARAGDMGDPYAESSYGNQSDINNTGNVGGTINNVPSQNVGSRCQSCGAPQTGNFCENCGSR